MFGELENKTRVRDPQAQVIDVGLGLENTALTHHSSVRDDIAAVQSMLTKQADGSPKPRDYARLAEAGARIGALMWEVALYSWPQGGKRIEGPTVKLVEALALEWGGLLTDVRIESIEGNRVMLRAVIFDTVRGNAYARPYAFSMSEPPGKFGQKHESAERWKTMQMQAAVSKCVRTALEHVLPAWYIEHATQAARTEARERNESKPLSQVIEIALAHFADKYGVSEREIEDYVGVPRVVWTLADTINLRRLSRKLQNGEETVDNAFRGGADAARAPAAPPRAGAGLAGLSKPTPAPAPEPDPSKRHWPVEELRACIEYKLGAKTAEDGGPHTPPEDLFGKVRAAWMLGSNEYEPPASAAVSSNDILGANWEPDAVSPDAPPAPAPDTLFVLADGTKVTTRAQAGEACRAREKELGLELNARATLKVRLGLDGLGSVSGKWSAENLCAYFEALSDAVKVASILDHPAR